MGQKTWSTLTANTDYATGANFIEGAAPVAGDDVIIGPSSTAIALNLNASAVELNSFWVQSGSPAIGTIISYLQIDVANGNQFLFDGTGTAYIDIGSSVISPIVEGTATPSTGYRGLYLKGSAFTALYCNGGHTGFAWQRNETSSATTIRVSGANTTFWGGPGVTNTTYTQYDGDNEIYFGNTTTNVMGGSLYTRGSGAITTMNCWGGYCYPCSSGTITTLNIKAGGYVDLTKSGVARTITTLNLDPGGTLIYDPAVVTITNKIAPSGIISILSSNPNDPGSWIYQATKAF